MSRIRKPLCVWMQPLILLSVEKVFPAGPTTPPAPELVGVIMLGVAEPGLVVVGGDGKLPMPEPVAVLGVVPTLVPVPAPALAPLELAPAALQEKKYLIFHVYTIEHHQIMLNQK